MSRNSSPLCCLANGAYSKVHVMSRESYRKAHAMSRGFSPPAMPHKWGMGCLVHGVAGSCRPPASVIGSHLLFAPVFPVVGKGSNYVVLWHPHFFKVQEESPLEDQITSTGAILDLLADIRDSDNALNVIPRLALVDNCSQDVQDLPIAVKGVA
ncbi:hypothetical protein BDK51DRAFT_25775 [Blyttiomyces helicus]|uniref:Uncharacterized protein n=1 Tax=Blyttiomyces helicus TaxID=388810 RepID=A0A4P9VZF0_9FUNG|nr:hypothetical protein BDK51DRAFT_25775 [Blyttiomyces helicus]|eukprot:RKO83196.1 hypothetical protein BDK51DRAFT_25775 [Blyttiomyces helicus]